MQTRDMGSPSGTNLFGASVSRVRGKFPSPVIAGKSVLVLLHWILHQRSRFALLWLPLDERELFLVVAVQGEEVEQASRDGVTTQAALDASEDAVTERLEQRIPSCRFGSSHP